MTQKDPAADPTVDRLWAALVTQMTEDHPGVARGKMMSADALTWDGKVFVFRSRRNGAGLGCKLGPDGDPSALAGPDWSPLQPFKTKAPMRGWYVIRPSAAEAWPRIATAALTHARKVADAA